MDYKRAEVVWVNKEFGRRVGLMTGRGQMGALEAIGIAASEFVAQFELPANRLALRFSPLLSEFTAATRGTEVGKLFRAFEEEQMVLAFCDNQLFVFAEGDFPPPSGGLSVRL